MKKNDKIVGICEDYTYDGHGIVKVNGFPLFVKGLMLHEKAEIIVTMVKKNYGYGKYLRLYNENKDRITPKCKLAKQCGGCQLQHMNTTHQAYFKQRQVEEVMKKIAKIKTNIHPIITMKDPWYYRNKTQIPIGSKEANVVCGFYRIHSNEIIDMNQCHIQQPIMNEIIQTMKELLQTFQNANLFRHIVMKYAKQSNEIMLAWVCYQHQITKQEEMVAIMIEKFPQIKTIVLNINKRNDNVILSNENIILYGNGTILESIDDIQYELSLQSFFQVNPIQTHILYQKVLEYAQLTNTEEVIDLYCGVGSISLFLAKQAKFVTGVEIVPQAVANAKRNKELNQIHNVEFICEDASNFAKECIRNNKTIDVVVVDPPRKGCDELTLSAIVTMKAKRIVYVSCNVATLARDLQRLSQMGYQVKQIQPVDMFPQTYGIEAVAQIEKV